jgi:hypothetical protein
MTQWETVIDQVRTFASQHAPPSLVGQGIPLALILLVGGIGMSVLGAKMARWGLVAAFVAAGGSFGAQFGRIVELHPMLCGGVGALLIGIIGYLTMRIWIGVIASALVTALALGAFGYRNVLPHLGEYEQISAAGEGSPTFSLPTPEAQAANFERSPREWATGFWTFVTGKDARVERNAQALAIVAMLAGLLFGLLATRAALVFSTSLVGTLVVITAVGVLMARFVPEFHQAMLHRPQVTGAAVGGFLVTSLILQTLLTRKAVAAKTKKPAAT